MVAQRTPRRIQLGREIAHMMAVSGINRGELARRMDYSPSRVTELLNGTATTTVGDVKMMAEVMGFGDDAGYVEALQDLRKNDNKRGFWTTGHQRAFREDFRLMWMLEREADLLRCVSSEIIPDILQCEQYMRALFLDEEEDDESKVEDYVAGRVQRQKVLQGPTDYHAVMSESCLTSEFGGADVMREQMRHLVKLSRKSNVSIQIVPNKARASGRKAVAVSFQLISLPPAPRSMAGAVELAYVAGPGEIRYIDEPNALAAYKRTWSRATAGAQPMEDSVQFIEYVAKRRYS